MARADAFKRGHGSLRRLRSRSRPTPRTRARGRTGRRTRPGRVLLERPAQHPSMAARAGSSVRSMAVITPSQSSSLASAAKRREALVTYSPGLSSWSAPASCTARASRTMSCSASSAAPACVSSSSRFINCPRFIAVSPVLTGRAAWAPPRCSRPRSRPAREQADILPLGHLADAVREVGFDQRPREFEGQLPAGRLRSRRTRWRP